MNKDNPAPPFTINELEKWIMDKCGYVAKEWDFRTVIKLIQQYNEDFIQNSKLDNPAPVLSAEEIKLSDLYRVVLEKVYAEETNTWQMMNKVNIESGMGGIKKNSLLQLIENVLENNPTQPISDEEKNNRYGF